MEKPQENLAHDGYHGLVRVDVLPHIPRGKGKLLDIGGGNGATALMARDSGIASQVGVADMVAGSDKLDFSYQGNLEAAGFLENIVEEQGKFDVIMANDILEHLVDPWAMVKRIHASLKPDGILVASIPNIRNYTALFPLFFKNRWDYQDAGILDRTHLRFFVRTTAIELATCSGLKLEKVTPSRSGGAKVRLIRKLTFGIFNSFTDRQYIVIARNT